MTKFAFNQNKNITECMRCGICCEKGGPAFHLEDKPLIEKGMIHARGLFTIRKGELVRENVQGQVLPAESDIVRMKGKKGSWACVFYDTANKECGIYAHRPVECRALKCWDTREIEEMYTHNRLTRRDLLFKISGIWDLIEDHENRCAYKKIEMAFKDLKDDNRCKSAIRTIVTTVRYDAEIRRLVVEKGHAASVMTDFLFGRPMMQTIEMFGYRVKAVDGRYGLIRIRSSIDQAYCLEEKNASDYYERCR